MFATTSAVNLVTVEFNLAAAHIKYKKRGVAYSHWWNGNFEIPRYVHPEIIRKKMINF